MELWNSTETPAFLRIRMALGGHLNRLAINKYINNSNNNKHNNKNNIENNNINIKLNSETFLCNDMDVMHGIK